MTDLARALESLRPDQRDVICSVIKVAEGKERIDDLAFVAALLEALEKHHSDTSVGWVIVSAHKQLLKVARDEGFEVGGRRILGRRKLAHALAAQLNADRDEATKLRAEIERLRELLAERDRRDEERERIRNEDQQRRDYLAGVVGSGAG
jgi:hypothetical protein